MADDRFVGAWIFDHAESRDGDDNPTGPLFEGWTGQITYTDQGRMGVHLMGPDRPLIGPAATSTATDAEKATALDTFVAYWGSYEVDDDAGIVTHTLDGISRGVATGTEFPRHFTIDAEMLVLSPPAADDGSRSYIHWRRAPS